MTGILGAVDRFFKRDAVADARFAAYASEP